MSSGTTRTAPKALGLFAGGLMVATALATAVTVLPSTPATAQNQLQAQAIDPSRGFADLVDRVMPAVVSVQVKYANASAEGGEGRVGGGTVGGDEVGQDVVHHAIHVGSNTATRPGGCIVAKIACRGQGAQPGGKGLKE